MCDVTQILSEIEQGDPCAAELPLVYYDGAVGHTDSVAKPTVFIPSTQRSGPPDRRSFAAAVDPTDARNLVRRHIEKSVVIRFTTGGRSSASTSRQ